MKFSEVFSTTGKVLLALLLIGVAVSIIFAIVHGLGSLATESSISKQNDERWDRDNREADGKPATMPLERF